MACGATIHEFNTVRKHLSRAKGGRLAQMAYPASIISLILSDVVGDDLDVIASGPTVPDSSTFQDTEKILKGYGVWDQLAPSVRNHLQKGSCGRIEDTPKSDNAAFKRCYQLLVGTNLQALKAAGREAERLGYRSLILSSKAEGEAREVAKFYAAIAKEVLSSENPLKPPACVLAGGETTVTLVGEGPMEPTARRMPPGRSPTARRCQGRVKAAWIRKISCSAMIPTVSFRSWTIW